ncbi:MAG: cytochrome d ubiquinol oxidase subunit II [Muribaculaceae bacterium]|nr:cytochrome d ubiquinol oxidase subunit II [Muribaculaceae bacterium]
MDYESLQIYWWLLISVLGAALVFLMFVQGGQTMLIFTKNTDTRTMLVNTLGRKWEFAFTTLVVFGGAFFASFPLFYSTSFGGAYWLWILILLGYVLQAVSYEFRSKKGNLLGVNVYDTFLFINGTIGCILIGVAVAMFFFGAEFTVNRLNFVESSSPVISVWGEWHGLEAIVNWKNLLLGFTILFLARVSASLYFINSIDDDSIVAAQKKGLLWNAPLFLVLFITFAIVLFTSNGYESVSTDIAGVYEFKVVAYKYFLNLVEMWWCATMLLIGVLMILYSLYRTLFTAKYCKGIWWYGIGVVLVVMSLFFISGYNNTAYYPSLLDINSSLSIRNSSSSEFTLTVMSVVSLIIPFVLGYIIWAWRSMNKNKMTNTEMKETSHKY